MSGIPDGNFDDQKSDSSAVAAAAETISGDGNRTISGGGGGEIRVPASGELTPQDRQAIERNKLDVDNALEQVNRNVQEHKLCQREKMELYKVCEKLHTMIKTKTEENNNTIVQLNEAMHIELEHVITTHKENMDLQKIEYESEKNELVKELAILRVEYEKITKAKRDVTKQCDVMDGILKYYKLDFGKMKKRISVLENENSDLKQIVQMSNNRVTELEKKK